jgi:3-deoxy-manno-octulosonate cytidylyltransferase (CMP-KDO synthetase)
VPFVPYIPFVAKFIDSFRGCKLSCYPVNRTVAIVPARLASTRLPGKALIDIAGKPMVCWVAERARLARNVDRVIVATDSQEIVDAVDSRGFEAVLTAKHHTSGTDRVAEVASQIPDAEIIVNVQGDEPLISPETIERAVDVMAAEISKQDGAGIVTTWEPIESLDDLLNPDLVKVVLNEHEMAVYFSRSPVPYVYRRDVLLEFTKWPPSQLEQIEALEQLRALEHGVKIKVVEACATSTGVDTAEDLARVRELVGATS